jgi:hypothetical protein
MSTSEPLSISTTMLRRHLSALTVGWFGDHEMPPADVSSYDDLARRVWLSAQRSGDEPWLALGLRHVLAQPDALATDLTNDSYAYSERQARVVLAHVLQHRPADSPDSPADPDVAEITLQDLTQEAWDDVKAKLAAV